MRLPNPGNGFAPNMSDPLSPPSIATARQASTRGKPTLVFSSHRSTSQPRRPLRRLPLGHREIIHASPRLVRVCLARNRPWAGSSLLSRSTAETAASMWLAASSYEELRACGGQHFAEFQPAGRQVYATPLAVAGPRSAGSRRVECRSSCRFSVHLATTTARTTPDPCVGQDSPDARHCSTLTTGVVVAGAPGEPLTPSHLRPSPR